MSSRRSPISKAPTVRSANRWADYTGQPPVASQLQYVIELLPVLPRSRHLPRASTDGSLTENTNKIASVATCGHACVSVNTRRLIVTNREADLALADFRKSLKRGEYNPVDFPLAPTAGLSPRAV